MDAKFKDYYQLLGVDRKATSEEIKVAYRELALKVHPDHNEGKEAHEKFVELNEAYHILTDIDKRRKYDHVYLRHYGLGKNQSEYTTRLELTRQKRASRYKRGRYTPRVRYHGMAGSKDNYYEEEKKRNKKKNYDTGFSDEYIEQIEAEYQAKMAGFRIYGGITRALAAILLVFCVGMVMEYLIAVPAEPETVIAQTFTPRAPMSIRIQTTDSRFKLHRKFGYLLNEGTEIKISKSLFQNRPTKIWVDTPEKTFELDTIRKNHSTTVILMFVIIVTAIGTLFTKNYPQTGATLGTCVIVQALWILSTHFFM